MCWSINPSVPAKTLKELIAYARANPGKLSYASGGHGSSPHLAAELLKTEAKIKIVHVPYKGTGPALQDIIAGHVQMMFSSVSPAKPHIESRHAARARGHHARSHGAVAGRRQRQRARDPGLRGGRVACCGRPGKAPEGRAGETAQRA